MDLASKYRTALHMVEIFDARDGTKSIQHSQTLPDKRSAQVHLLAAMAAAPRSGVHADGCGGAGCCRMLPLGGGFPENRQRWAAHLAGPRLPGKRYHPGPPARVTRASTEGGRRLDAAPGLQSPVGRQDRVDPES